MKTKFLLSIVVLLVIAYGGAAIAQSQSESLGDYARAVRKTKPATEAQKPAVFDNDNIPADASISVVGNQPPDDASDAKAKDQSPSASADAASSDAKKDATKADKKGDPQLKPGQPMEERDQALDALKKRLDEQKKKVDLLAQDLDISQREYNLKAASFYSDPNRLTNPNSYYQDQDKFKQEVAEKQKALDDAKAELADMQDKARKQGAPESTLQ